MHGHATTILHSGLNSLDHTQSSLTSLGMAVARPDHTTRGSYAGITVAAFAMDESAAAALSKATASTEMVAMTAVGVTACAAKRGPFVVHVLTTRTSLAPRCNMLAAATVAAVLTGSGWTDLPGAPQTMYQHGVPHTDKHGRTRVVYDPTLSFLPLVL